MIHAKFSVIPFHKMSFDEWKFAYQSDIRVNIELGAFKKPKTGITLADESMYIWIPWYKKGNWRYGEPTRMQLGKNLCVVRVPAVKFFNAYLLLDGLHRVTTLKPAMVVMDWFEVKGSQRNYVTDLIGDFWG